AQNGALTVMVGGDKPAFERAKPVIANYARLVSLIGPAGAGQLTKMVNQICIAGLVEGLAEGIHFAQRAGLDIAAVMEAIQKGAAGSWQMENRWKTTKANSTSVSPSTGCARTSQSASQKPSATVHSCRSRPSSTPSTRKCNRWAATAGI